MTAFFLPKTDPEERACVCKEAAGFVEHCVAIFSSSGVILTRRRRGEGGG